MRSPIRVTIALVLTFLAAETFAAVSQKYNDWRNGPVQWIMTADEQKAWRNVKTDEEAIRFIDLFWARRDPTPGTPHNTYRDEFDARVRYADQNYTERGRKGSMTDRGRAFIILGAPQFGGGSAATAGSLSAMGTGQGAGRSIGATEQWTWEREEAMRKFGLPRVLVAFTQDPITQRWTRDVTRPDFVPASKAAIEKSIVSPNLTEVPEWAAQGGLEPKVV
ncbi:MAG TPA: GWxTD domain-containing protein, partial [Thermoanaerobaculia bacterium]|nr:GWxTD domain-containing protein [Thermoanaerobaculia bacterium]